MDEDVKPRFAPPPASTESPAARPWKLLVVDDEPEVHSVTRLALGDFRFDGRPLEFISAYSGAEARDVIANDPEIAVVLLDVVMETDDAGLQVVQYVRRVLGNMFIRIILRTGHPGVAPERRVIKAYDINDYRAKTELTQDRMYSLMYTSLRAYKHMTAMAASRRHTAALADEYRSVLNRVSGLLLQPAAQIQQAGESLLRSSNADRASLAQLQKACAELGDIVGALERLGALSEPGEVPEEFDTGEALAEVMDNLSGQIRETHAIIRHGELPVLTGHPQLFSELMTQLLRNALENGGDAPPSVEIGAEAQGKDWKFTVSDSGRGIPIDRQDKIFEAFSSADESVRAGIGLAICRRIVALHGGRIWVEPRPGGGSRFSFTLPAGGVIHGGA